MPFHLTCSSDKMFGSAEHGTIIRTGITWLFLLEISGYMNDSACRWFIVKKAKIF